MNAKHKKRLRTIGHQLRPVVTVAGNGLSDAVLTELNRALDDHELIKVKIIGDREERKLIVEAIAAMADTDVIQAIGGVALIYRPAREANPALSNIARTELLL